jgi:V-type H+-transporting ATPase subunit C
MADKNEEYFIVAFPSAQDGHDSTWRTLEKHISGPDSVASLFHFDVPQLRVGTLEKLLAGGDTLSKLDDNVRQITRKIERAFADVIDSAETLQVENSSVTEYVQKFRWSSAKYQSSRPVDELIRLIQQNVQKIDDELKEAVAMYQEAKATLSGFQRKKGGASMQTSFADYLMKVNPKNFVCTEYLVSLCVIVQKSNEKEFLSTYENVGDDVVGYGPADDRQSVLGSPVVPKSAQLVVEPDKEGNMIYLIVVLKNFTKEYIARVLSKKKQYVVKEWLPPSLVRALASQQVHMGDELDEHGGGGGHHGQQQQQQQSKDSQQQQQQTEDHGDLEKNAETAFEKSRQQLRRWAKAHYGEVFIAWLHVKCIRVFVEAVLMYGLPVNFLAALIKPNKKTSEKKIRQQLKAAYVSLVGDQAVTDFDDGEKPHAATGEGGAAMSAEKFFPYASFTFKPTGD